ncbi:MAG: HIT domain-containing protein [Actinomycetota bacterium]
MDRIEAGWRLAVEPGMGADGLPRAVLEAEPGKSLFETIEQSDRPDEETYVVCRRASAFVVLNVFPYTSGHTMVLPKRAVRSMLELDDQEYRDLWDLVRLTYRAVGDAFGPEGMNVGLNEGRAGGGSVPEHLHVHVVPRWYADTSFMTTSADARVLPMTLRDSWLRLRAAWPEPLPSDR